MFLLDAVGLPIGPVSEALTFAFPEPAGRGVNRLTSIALAAMARSF
jgi:hypothetical protein